MSEQLYHLAQANIARAIAPLTDPVMRSFVDQLDSINAVADRSPGFVWRLQSDEGDATGIRAFDDPLIVVNLSGWESAEALYDYVYRSEHIAPLRERRKWFARVDAAHSVMWWAEAGRLPAVEEVPYRLDLLRSNGPTPAAFTFAALFDPQGRPIERAAGTDHGCTV